MADKCIVCGTSKEPLFGGGEDRVYLHIDCVDNLEIKLADKEKELKKCYKDIDDLILASTQMQRGYKNLWNDNQELRSKIETFKKSFIKREKEHQDALIELMAEGLKLCSCIHRERNIEWRKKIERVRKKYTDWWETKGIKGIKPMLDIDTIFEEILDGSSKSEEEVASRFHSSDARESGVSSSSDDAKPKDFLEKFASQTDEEVRESGKKIMKKYKKVFDGLAKS